MSATWSHQEELSDQASELLSKFGVAYLSMEMRTGKTRTAFLTAIKRMVKLVLFVTKKKAIEDISKQFIELYGDNIVQWPYQMIVTNYEQLDKVEPLFDMVIIDESHNFGAFPVPSQRTEKLREICVKAKYVLLLSGTPSPESLVQLYHQFWAAGRGPWVNYKNFYAWAKDYVFVEKMKVNATDINDYSMAKGLSIKEFTRTLNSSRATESAKQFARKEIDRITAIIEEKKNLILDDVQPYMIAYTQEEAGFTSTVEDKILKVPMPDTTARVINALVKKKVFATKAGTMVTADTAAKQMGKIQQACGGSMKDDDGNIHLFDFSKAEFIYREFADRRLVIFYKYIGERKILERVFGDQVVESVDAFKLDKRHDAVLLLQFMSGREGTDCSTADEIIFYAIDFSAVSYIQARARLQNKSRDGVLTAYWIFMENGIEPLIYERVSNKMDYTTIHYRGYASKFL